MACWRSPIARKQLSCRTCGPTKQTHDLQGWRIVADRRERLRPKDIDELPTTDNKVNANRIEGCKAALNVVNVAKCDQVVKVLGHGRRLQDQFPLHWPHVW